MTITANIPLKYALNGNVLTDSATAAILASTVMSERGGSFVLWTK